MYLPFAVAIELHVPHFVMIRHHRGISQPHGSNDRYISSGNGKIVIHRPGASTALRECDEIREILAPRVLYAIGQHDNALRR